jgi:multisubunit Na+/H+ antiporter MnhC subunit
MALLSLGLFLHRRELNLLLHWIDAVDDHANPITEAKRLSAALADDLPRVLVIRVTVIGEGGERHQPFHEQIR